MTSDFHIIPVSAQELKALQGLSRQTFRESFGGENTEANMRNYLKLNLSASRLRSELNEPNSSFFFARHGGELSGYLKLNAGPAQTAFHYPNALEIERLYVLRNKQGQRIGQGLLDHALEIARQHGAERVWLGVWEANQRAIAFYERNGFEPFGRHPFLLGSDLQTDILMHRPSVLP